MKNGLLIALSGVDGSGKSTQVELLRKHFVSQKKSVNKMVTFEYYLLKPLIAVSKNKNKGSKAATLKVNTNPALKLWFIPALFDFWVIHLVKIRPILSKYDCVLSDRYFLDMAVSMVTYGYMPESIFAWYCKLLPPAKTHCVINIAPHVAHKRSKEFSKKYYIGQVGLYNMATQGKKIKSIDGRGRKKQVFDRIVKSLNQ